MLSAEKRTKRSSDSGLITHRILDQRNCHNSVVLTSLMQENKDEGHIIRDENFPRIS